MGYWRSLQLQFFFNEVVSRAGTGQGAAIRRWYQRPSIRIPPPIMTELRGFYSRISDDLDDPSWRRPIGLLVPRVPTITVFTDASTLALGGWSPASELNHMWRITIDDLVAAGISRKMSWNNRQNYHEPDIDPKGFHINILEFFAIIIELWITLRQLHLAHSALPSIPSSTILAPAESIPPGGHRLLARADNTSALSWLRYATRTKRAPVRRLARLLTALLCHPFPSAFCQVQGKHIAGIVNISADHLSRFEKSPSWEAVMANCVHLRTLRTCQFQREVLSIIVWTFLREQTEEWYETATTRLWTIEPPVFATGSQRLAGTTTSVAPVP
jgi:hypothetical protein